MSRIAALKSASAFRRLNAARPSFKVTGVYPSFVTIKVTKCLITGSSSAIRIRLEECLIVISIAFPLVCLSHNRVKHDFCWQTLREGFGEITDHEHQGNTTRHIGLAHVEKAA